MSHPIDKEAVLADAAQHIEHVRAAATTEEANATKSLSKIDSLYKAEDDQSVREKLKTHFAERLEQLHHLFSNPYFFRCDVTSTSGDKKNLYFSKFPMTDQSIFSWASPAARLRFSDIGSVAYKLPDGKSWNGSLQRKDQFMIVEGRIVFMASEAEGYGRTLIHQERLAQRKAGFMLPEIVERMEKAQDDVIRASATGSFLIAGPAGSGKTTLALHRLAYLLQSPDTSERFPSRTLIVFVQDEHTKDYFSRLLPDLGIHEVEVTTFGTWAINILQLKDASFIRRPNGIDESVDTHEYHKCLALRTKFTPSKRFKDPFALLREVYATTFTTTDKQLFTQQAEKRELDRFDLTILLQESLKRGAFTKQEEYLVQSKNYSVTRKQKTVPRTYQLMVVDEAQNYLPEQLTILRTAIDPSTKAMLYVGDLGQQVLLGTLRDWQDAQENFESGQKVQLEKVYRNTQNILRYISSLGFDVSIPKELREGSPVKEVVCQDVEDEIARIKSMAKGKTGEIIGIISPSANYLKPFAERFADQKNVHVLTIHESQGVEFDIVVLVGLTAGFFTQDESQPALKAERLRIKRDLIYVALTRAMDELYVFGSTELSKIFPRSSFLV